MKKIDIRLNDEEAKKLENLSAAAGISKAAVLKSSLQPRSTVLLMVINNALFNISGFLDRGDMDAIREEMMRLCLTLNS